MAGGQFESTARNGVASRMSEQARRADEICAPGLLRCRTCCVWGLAPEVGEVLLAVLARHAGVRVGVDVVFAAP
jgi:hypothetical protein